MTVIVVVVVAGVIAYFAVPKFKEFVDGIISKLKKKS